MPFAVFVDEVVLSRQRRHALLARLLMSAIDAEGFKVMTKFFIANEPLTLLTFFIICMVACFYLSGQLRLCDSWGRHLRHFMCGGCLQTNSRFYSCAPCWLVLRFLLTRQLMHMPLSPWLHLLVRYILERININFRLITGYHSCPNSMNSYTTSPPICRTFALTHSSSS